MVGQVSPRTWLAKGDTSAELVGIQMYGESISALAIMHFQRFAVAGYEDNSPSRFKRISETYVSVPPRKLTAQ